MDESFLKGAILLLLLWSVCNAMTNISSPDTSSRLSFDEAEFFARTNWYVYHMEKDLHRNDGSILYTDRSRLVTTNGVKSRTVKKISREVRGFKQLNSITIVVSDSFRHCVKVLNRLTGTVRTIAGICGTYGYVDGKLGLFNFPSAIELDRKDPNKIYVADYFNHLIRVVNVINSEVTSLQLTMLFPEALTWHNDELIVSNNYAIKKITWNADDQITITTIMEMHQSDSAADGRVKLHRFLFPKEIYPISDHQHLIADYGNNILHLLDMNRQALLPVCFGDSLCEVGTPVAVYPISILKVDDALYVGALTQIVKAKFKVVGNRTTVQIANNYTTVKTPDRYTTIKTANNYTAVQTADNYTTVEIPDNYTITKMLGKFTTTATITDNSTTVEIMKNKTTVTIADSYSTANTLKNTSTVKINKNYTLEDSDLRQRLVFEAKYNVYDCQNIQSNSTQSTILETAKLHFIGIAILCGKECSVLPDTNPDISCNNAALIIHWPTDTVYARDVTEISPALKSALHQKISKFMRNTIAPLPIQIPTINPSIVFPLRGPYGQKIYPKLIPFCANNAAYNPDSEQCYY